MSVGASAAASLAVALVATPLAMVAARRLDIVDRPGRLKVQTAPVPYLGGVAVLAGIAAGIAVDHPAWLLPLGAALALGVADDRFELPPWTRLVGEVGVGVAVVVTSPVRFAGPVAAVLVVAVTVVLINGVNLLDGLDLLASGVALVSAVAFAWLLHGPGRLLGACLGAALIGFMVFNRPPARIYLGDGGSYLLGASLAVLLAVSWGPSVPFRVGAAALVLVAVPAGELAFAIWRRWRGHRPLMAGDRGHPYDRLVDRGWSRPSASGAYLAVQALLAAAAVTVARHGTGATTILLDVACGAVLVVLAGAAGGLAPDQETSR